jgi:hypothetical protein
MVLAISLANRRRISLNVKAILAAAVLVAFAGGDDGEDGVVPLDADGVDALLQITGVVQDEHRSSVWCATVATVAASAPETEPPGRSRHLRRSGTTTAVASG